MNIELGYACINLDIGGFRTYNLEHLTEYNQPLIKEVILHNLHITIENIKWNVERRIRLYRLTSELIPKATHPLFKEWQTTVGWFWYEDTDILAQFNYIYQLNMYYNLHLTLHPGQYTVINALKEDVYHKSLEDLIYHWWVLEKIGGHFLIIHVGGKYGDKQKSLDRFIDRLRELPEPLLKKLVIENDDKVYTIDDVLEVCKAVSVKPLFDFHHNRCNPVPNIRQSLGKVVDIWKGETNYIKVHLSSGATHDKDRSHSDYVKVNDLEDLVELFAPCKLDTLAVMLECKMKNKSVLNMRRD